MTGKLNKRQEQLLEILTLKGEVKIAEIRDHFGVTEMTVRRDLEKLEIQGVLKRTFGGAILNNDIDLQKRNTVHLEEKVRIGKRAAELIERGDSIFIDGGSTTLQVARFIKEDFGITVVTNALNIATELATKRIPTIMIGGMIVEKTNSLVGPIAEQNISRMVFDKVFLGATGLHVKHGFSNSNLQESQIKSIAIEKAKQTIVVMDHTKFGKSVLISFAQLHEVHKIVTDSCPEQELLDSCKTMQVDLIQA